MVQNKFILYSFIQISSVVSKLSRNRSTEKDKTKMFFLFHFLLKYLVKKKSKKLFLTFQAETLILFIICMAMAPERQTG